MVIPGTAARTEVEWSTIGWFPLVNRMDMWRYIHAGNNLRPLRIFTATAWHPWFVKKETVVALWRERLEEAERKWVIETAQASIRQRGV